MVVKHGAASLRDRTDALTALIEQIVDVLQPFDYPTQRRLLHAATITLNLEPKEKGERE